MRRALLVVLLLATACARRGDPVRSLLDDAVKDAEKKDAESLASRLATDFSAADGEDRAAMELTLRRFFFAYQSVGVKLTDVTIERSPDAAQVAFRADISGAPREGGLASLLPRSASYRFDLRLVREGDRWKVSQAAWRPLSGDGP
jgi:hypothetical protein